MNLPSTFAQWLPLGRTVLTVAAINTGITALLVPFLENRFLDLLITAQIIGFANWAAVRPVFGAPMPPWLRGIALLVALTVATSLGTILVNVVKGRELMSAFTDPAGQVRFGFTVLLGVVIGAVISAVWFARWSIARAEAELMRSEADRQRLARQHAEAELAVIRAQIEPHFLFNTLANLSYLIKDNPGQAQAMLENLIDYLQAAVPRIRGEQSTLRAELTMATSYLSILQIRMGERLTARVDVPAELLSVQVPPMMLVTLVENAIKHGLNELAEGGEVAILVRREVDRLVLSVADTGIGLVATGAPLRPGFGLDNIRQRLAAMYGERATLRLEPNQPRGTIATIELPT